MCKSVQCVVLKDQHDREGCILRAGTLVTMIQTARVLSRFDTGVAPMFTAIVTEDGEKTYAVDAKDLVSASAEMWHYGDHLLTNVLTGKRRSVPATLDPSWQGEVLVRRKKAWMLATDDQKLQVLMDNIIALSAMNPS